MANKWSLKGDSLLKECPLSDSWLYRHLGINWFFLHNLVFRIFLSQKGGVGVGWCYDKDKFA